MAISTLSPREQRKGEYFANILRVVVGAQEKESRTVNIRNRDDPSTQSKGDLVPLDVALQKLEKLRASQNLVNVLSD